MQLCWKRRSDPEHVENVRRFLLRSKWFRVIYACSAVGFFALFWLWWELIPRLTGNTPELDEAARHGFSVGVMLGAMAGLALLFAAVCGYLAMRSVTGERTMRLMVKFYDELKKRELGIQPAHPAD